MQLMRNHIRPYVWGSKTAIARLRGDSIPTAQPQAELWIGAHPSGPSEIVSGLDARSLIEVIDADPNGTVGPVVAAEFGARLPFLLKILAADAPLSLQVHPTAEQAADGYAAEEAKGIPVDAPNRNYRDASHKPELICALTEFRALCGFRPVTVTLRALRLLRVPGLTEFIEILVRQPDARGIADVVDRFNQLPPQRTRSLCRAVEVACSSWIAAGGGEFDRDFRNVLNLAQRYPGDPGVLVSLLMNHLRLQPGEAIYLPAGNLHAYLSGVGVEIMASSDNVLRGGLTAKHVDVPELMRVLDCTPGEHHRVTAIASGAGEWSYPTPTAEFLLSRIELTADQVLLEHPGAQILLAVAGELTVTEEGGRTAVVPSGHSLFIPASQGRVWLSGSGTAFRARDGIGLADLALDEDLAA